MSEQSLKSFLTACISCAVVLAAPLAVMAQVPEPPNLMDHEKRLQALEDSVKGLGSTVQGLQDAQRSALMEIKQLQNDIAQHRQEINALNTLNQDQETRLSTLRQNQDSLTAQVNEQFTRQQQILDAISTTDAQGTRIPRLSAVMSQSEEFRKDVGNAVHQSLQRQGQLAITNRMSTTQRISVNRQDFDVSPGEVLTLRVPTGTVTTQLPGQVLKNWTITAPDYQESISIVPQPSQQTVLRAPVRTFVPAFSGTTFWSW